MELKDLQAIYADNIAVNAYAKVLEKQSVRTIFLEGLCASATPLVSSVVFNKVSGSYLFVLNDVEDAGYFYHDLVQIMGDKQVLFFPSSYRRAIKYGQRDAANEILRTEVLSQLQTGGGSFIIVTYPEAIAEKVVSQDTLYANTIEMGVNEKLDTKFIIETLREFGFEYVDYVYEPGQFAVRGSIIDVFSFASEYPFRIDFFGDEIDSIRSFDVETQLSKERMERISVVPELNNGKAKEEVPFLYFIADNTVVGFKDIQFVGDRISVVHDEALSPQALKTMEEEGNGTSVYRANLIDGADFFAELASFRTVEFGHKPLKTPQARIAFSCIAQPIYHKNFDLVSSSFRDYLQRGYTLYICSDSAKQTERLRAIFDDRGDKFPFIPVDKTIHEGYVDNQLKSCFFTDHQIFDRFHKYNLRSDKARSGKVALSIKELNQFQIGDYVVHTDHGVGRFAGLARIPQGNSTQEMMKLIYQHDDVVLVSIHSLHKISKYKGKEGEPPKLSYLGTGAWEKMKDRTKKRIKDIARDLIRLYAQRKDEKGFAYSADSFMQHELEASFIYEDTPDQLKTTQEVKKDMERAIPMDRLVCGDVGFGKTEIAVRAAFKAVADNKQVAVLVPTTVLALQHYKTFGERLKDFPCRVDYLSRARSPKQTTEILKDLKEGKINIIIGTHRLISKSVQFKDLGLLVVDEEQKFGVSVKEKLRKIKVNVDTLTMTATPIPRTLQFSLMGARDLSVITTPPPNRFPIQTEVHTFNKDILKEAINFEMSRNGQVFIVNNRVHNLPEMEDLIRRLVPDARICVGHGQMDPQKLEKVIFDFINFDYDVLLATSIIESGIDMPNVNTIIINNAQTFGLSDLHQLRGRVGRSNRKAFCYLLAPPLNNLTPEAKRRLQAIENFSDLGSGIHIAMQDLDIRGAGNLLGSEQSGFVADLGYEAYQKILMQAVQELKNEEFSQLYVDEAKAKGEVISGDDFVEECNVESDMELLFPESYIPSSSERMLLYRELDNLVLDTDVELFRSRLEDRFGKIPPQGEELIRIVKLRRLARKMGVERVLLRNGIMSLYFINDADSLFYQSETSLKVIRFLQANSKNCKLRESSSKRSMLVKSIQSVEQAVHILEEMYAD
jgi:transcription-repair coupling factor (superfamily II helicase)